MFVLRNVIASGIRTRAYSAASSNSSMLKVNVNNDGVALVELDKPPINSLCPELLDQLHKTFIQLETDRCKGMILTSTSPTVFTAGLDIQEMYNKPPDAVRRIWHLLQSVWIKLYSAPYATVAAINGHSPAGGCLLSVACEYRIIVPKVKIGANEIQLGIIPTEWFQNSVKSVIGEKLAERAFTSGTLFTSEQALEIGLVDEIASDREDLLNRANKFIGKHLRLSALARNTVKLSIREENLTKLTSNREADINTFANFLLQPSVQENLGKYLAKKKIKN